MIAHMAAAKKTTRSKEPPASTSRRTAKTAVAPGQRSPKTKRDPAIDAYLAGVDTKTRRLLQDLRKTIHTLVPEVVECISYQLPAFRYDGRVIAGFASRSTGGSYYPFSGTTLATLADDLEGYSQTKSALHFEGPLPLALVRKLLAARIAEGARR
jgi:uncharacterized protein YdhG (YjbR/CyaY superfamily)